MNTKRHIELNVHSKYSSRESVITPEEIVKFAVNDGAKAIAITDLNNILAFHEFSKAASKEKFFKAIYGVRLYCGSTQKEQNPFVVTLLAQNKIGLKNIYKIISSGYNQIINEKPWPYVDIEYLKEHREGVLIGMECRWGYIYHSIDKENLSEIIKIDFELADYVEFRPWYQNIFQKVYGYNVDEYKLAQTATKFATLFQSLNIPPVAVSNANCITNDDKICWEILNQDEPKTSAEHAVTLKNTECVLQDFSCFGQSVAEDLVLNNPNAIAESIELFNPCIYEFNQISLPNSEQEVKEYCQKALSSKYGLTPPNKVQERLNDEFQKISFNGFWSYYLLAKKIADRCNELGFLYTCRICAGSSFVAYLLGITECNPLPPHYYCPSCKTVKFVNSKEYLSGFDLIRKKCSICGSELEGDGHNIPCEFFMGYEGETIPNFDFNVPEEATDTIYSLIGELFGAKKIAYAGYSRCLHHDALFLMNSYKEKNEISLTKEKEENLIDKLRGVYAGHGRYPGGIAIAPGDNEIEDFTPLQYLYQHEFEERKPITQIDYHECGIEIIDILTHPMLSEIKLMEEYTGISSKSINFNDIDIFSFFTDENFAGLPFDRKLMHQMLGKVFPVQFSDLLKLFGFVHGTNVWTNNAENLMESTSISKLIAFRDDVMISLLHDNINREDAFHIAECVRKGIGSKCLDENTIKILKKHGVEEWYIDSMKKIRNLSPKAHAVEYLINYLRMIWYKIYYPAEFYAAVLTYNITEFFDYSILAGCRTRVEIEMNKFDTTHDKDYEFTEWNDDKCEKQQRETLKIVLECFDNGIEFLPADINVSAPYKFIPRKNTIRIPLFYPEEKRKEQIIDDGTTFRQN